MGGHTILKNLHNGCMLVLKILMNALLVLMTVTSMPLVLTLKATSHALVMMGFQEVVYRASVSVQNNHIMCMHAMTML